MRKIYLLDCTLRDGGYVNDWRFGEETIKGFGKKIAQTGIEMFEIGFIKGDSYDPNRSVFPDIASISAMIQPKADGLMYIGMLDMSAPIPLERIFPYDGTSIDGIRVIFKKEKINDAYVYCKRIKDLGYKLFVNFVGIDLYTDKEFIEGLEKFNELKPFSMVIVDSFGLIKRKHFLRLVSLADNNMVEGITLCYHAHNNLQQAFGNAEALVEMNLKRDLCIDACVFGMGRGAGNLNLELFAEYMNENYDAHYRIEPMLEIMDEYLNNIYRSKFWGYSLPLYLSASTGCHPNYAIYLAERDSLTVKSFNELLKGIQQEEKVKFSKEKAEKYYRQYQENYIDDKEAIGDLATAMAGKHILLIAPGKSLSEYANVVETEAGKDNTVVIAVNFCGGKIQPNYVFSSNMRRFIRIQGKTDALCITTSNMKDCEQTDFVVNFSSYASNNAEIIDNSGLMALRLLVALGVKEASIAGMDGYSAFHGNDYFDQNLEFDFTEEANLRNTLISAEIKEIQKLMKLRFITPTYYNVQ
ncbi:aldolase catalytic domain-containing protein [Desulfosporosinus sp. BG]|uniref:aldolase catalytic domain-containing protein n=1 Tax=Desulfosporosinus sp. BG TaxID=1633135 RepID=UPI00083AA5E0|nr:aldolase catalytic domain-containing protein [Desulfosporosinus sp. BG]ODA39142.1 4-hydroxy-2-oxovalerate aldolase [Desulfosporosinus sp. BG]